MKPRTDLKGRIIARLTAIAAITAMAQPCFAQSPNNPIRCHIEGMVADSTDCKMVLLVPANGTERWSKTYTIRVNDGQFCHEISTNENVVMHAIPCNDKEIDYSQTARFFVEDGTVTIRFYVDKETERPEVESGAPLNKELIALNKYIFDTFKRDHWMRLDRLEKTGPDTTEVYRNEEKELSEGRKKGERYALDYARNNINLVGMFYLEDLLYNEERCEDITEEELTTLFDNAYAPKFPDSSISTGIRSYIASRNIRPEGRFIDFTAPDLDGRDHTLSEEIAGKVALIDFRASWCGPCRRNSQAMIPIYEAFRERGFTIVGVARERNDDAAMRKAIEHDGYPWLNLIELNDKAHIFDLYGLRYSAGGTVLIDRNGTILAINPKPEEVREILEANR